MNIDHLEMLAEVASLYYEENLSQEIIGERIGRSRSMVSRLLHEARDVGLVEIQIHHSLRWDSELQSQLCNTFPLSDAIVLAESPQDYKSMLCRIGELGARYVRQQLHNGITLGISWGTGVYEVVKALPSEKYHDTQVVQIIGSVGFGDPLVDGAELARWMAEKLGGHNRSLYAPLIVGSVGVARGLLQDRNIAETLELASRAEVALIGIGVIDPPSLTGLLRAGYVDESDLARLRQSGAVAEVLSHPLNLQGQVVGQWFVERSIGIRLETLRSIPRVVAVAGGEVKAPAILAALRSGCVNVLVSDAATVKAVLALNENSA